MHSTLFGCVHRWTNEHEMKLFPERQVPCAQLVKHLQCIALAKWNQWLHNAAVVIYIIAERLSTRQIIRAEGAKMPASICIYISVE